MSLSVAAPVFCMRAFIAAFCALRSASSAALRAFAAAAAATRRATAASTSESGRHELRSSHLERRSCELGLEEAPSSILGATHGHIVVCRGLRVADLRSHRGILPAKALGLLCLASL